MKVNNAYSVLGNKVERRTYDLEVIMKSDPRWREKDVDVKTDSPHVFRTRPMTFEERARSMGFKAQDPNFYRREGNYHQKVVTWCVVFIGVGMLVQGVAVMALYNRHTTALDFSTAENNQIIMTARANPMRYTTLADQREAVRHKWEGENIRLEQLEHGSLKRA